jgi:hypothetical protein
MGFNSGLKELIVLGPWDLIRWYFCLQLFEGQGLLPFMLPVPLFFKLIVKGNGTLCVLFY